MISKLGSKFPKSYQVDFCNKHLVPGAVLCRYTHQTKPPKIKRIVIIGINKDSACVGYLFINSKINFLIKKNPNLYNLQLFLSQKNCPYLKYNSYLDCSHIYELGLDDMKREFMSNPEIYIGQMSDSYIIKTKRKARSANTIENKLKKRYGL